MAASATSAKPFGLSASEKPRANLVGRFMRAACEPVSPASLAAFRIIFGLIGLIAVVRFMANGWVSDVYIEPVHHLTYTGFGWVQPWPAWGMHLHFSLLGLASLGVALGYRYRLSIIAFSLLFTYVESIDQTTYLNHYYLVSLISFIMVFMPMARVASLDSRPRQRQSGNKSTDEHLENDGDHPAVARGTLWLLRAQLGLVYVFAGIAKLNGDWLVEAQPLTIWLYNSTSTPIVGTFLREPWLPYAMSWAGAVFDLTIVGWLLWRRTRPYAYVLLVLFHLATALLFPAIGMFPWIMMGCALIFLDADWPERLSQRIRRKRGLLTPQPYETTPIARGATAPSWPVQVAFLLGALFLMLQVLLPLRHLAYPRQRAMERGRIPLLVEGAGDGEDGPCAISSPKLKHGRRGIGLPGAVSDTDPSGTRRLPARPDTGYCSYCPERFRERGPSGCGSPG